MPTVLLSFHNPYKTGQILTQLNILSVVTAQAHLIERYRELLINIDKLLLGAVYLSWLKLSQLKYGGRNG